MTFLAGVAREQLEIILLASASRLFIAQTRRGGRKRGFAGNCARRANRTQNQFGFFQIHTAS